MSDHISGPRALADPIADITDVYAFPSPERPGHLVLVMNTLPFAKPSNPLSDGLLYRFRLRPLTATAPGDQAPFAAGDEEFVFDIVFSHAHGRASPSSRTARARRRPARPSRSGSTTNAAARGTACARSPARAGIRSSSTRPRR